MTRTLHRGVIRKRILPIKLFENGLEAFTPDLHTHSFVALPTNSDLLTIDPLTGLATDVGIGKIVTINGNLGLALVRLEETRENIPVPFAVNLTLANPPRLIYGTVSNPRTQ